MKYKKALIIICTILFFLTAITFYLNRVIFPHLVKKIAIENIQEALKRKVEIDSIHFNWFRGFIIDKIKIYEKDSAEAVFAQADQVSFGILIFPGFKHCRITIPFINVRSPSVHLIRTAQDNWNFSDMFASPSSSSTTATPAATPSKAPNPYSLQIAWGGITVNNGKFLVDDLSNLSAKHREYFDNVNLKLSLSYKGINYDFNADLPEHKGLIGATVYYQPITKDTEAQIRLKNIDLVSYLSLVNIPDVHVGSGTIEEINLNIIHTQNNTSAQGDVLMKDLDIKSLDQGFKGDISIRGLDAQYQNGNINARGQMALSHAQVTAFGLYAAGSVQARVNDFKMSPEGLVFSGSLRAQDLAMNLKDRQVQLHTATLDNIKVKQDKDGIQSEGNISTQGLLVQWPDAKFQGDLDFKNLTMHMKDENDIRLGGQLEVDNFATSLAGKNFSSQRILLDDAQAEITDQKNAHVETKLTVDGMTLQVGDNLTILASVKTDKLSFNLNDDIINLSTNLHTSQTKIILDQSKIVEADPQVELSLQLPLNDMKNISYKGSVTLSDGVVRGLGSMQSLNNIELDADFENDMATINALSANFLDTNVQVSGTVKNFKRPMLNINAQAQELNLSKIKAIFPRLTASYGLSFDGTSSVKVKFEGLAADPLSARILATASIKDGSVSSAKFHQRINNITGTIEATPDSLQWHDITATYLNKKYTLSGTVDDFKHPAVLLTVEGPGLQFKADLTKNNNHIKINTLTGKYLDAAFDTKGTIALTTYGPVFDIDTNASLLLEDLVPLLPVAQKKILGTLSVTGMVSMTAKLHGTASDWKNYTLDGSITSPTLHLMGYGLTDMRINVHQNNGKVNSLVFDGKLYDGIVHAVGSMDLLAPGMPYDLALNINSTDLHELKMDSPLKMEEINGKFYLTTLANGTIADFKNNLHATGSLAIRDGFLAQFNLFKGLLSVLNDALRLGEVEITDVEGNFTIDNQKINTDNLRLKGPTIVLLTQGWVNFDHTCDLNVAVDLSSGVVPAIAHDVLSSLKIHIYDRIEDPKFKKKISVPQVINTLLRNLLQ